MNTYRKIPLLGAAILLTFGALAPAWGSHRVYYVRGHHQHHHGRVVVIAPPPVYAYSPYYYRPYYGYPYPYPYYGGISIRAGHWGGWGGHWHGGHGHHHR